MEYPKNSTQASTPEHWICKGTCGIRQKVAWKGFFGMATEKASDEGVHNMWEECRLKQRLTEASLTKSTQEVVIREYRQCHDYGDTKDFRGTHYYTETISFQ